MQYTIHTHKKNQYLAYVSYKFRDRILFKFSYVLICLNNEFRVRGCWREAHYLYNTSQKTIMYM